MVATVLEWRIGLPSWDQPMSSSLKFGSMYHWHWYHAIAIGKNACGSMWILLFTWHVMIIMSWKSSSIYLVHLLGSACTRGNPFLQLIAAIGSENPCIFNECVIGSLFHFGGWWKWLRRDSHSDRILGGTIPTAGQKQFFVSTKFGSWIILSHPSPLLGESLIHERY